MKGETMKKKEKTPERDAIIDRWEAGIKEARKNCLGRARQSALDYLLSDPPDEKLRREALRWEAKFWGLDLAEVVFVKAASGTPGSGDE